MASNNKELAMGLQEHLACRRSAIHLCSPRYSVGLQI
jgi:hypothetical protein